MVNCRRCGLPRRRPLLTPDGTTFSFPGFAVRRHRGLLLASGAALCCCCTEVIPNGDNSSSGKAWTGGTYTNIDEWPGDDATTEMTVTLDGTPGNINATILFDCNSVSLSSGSHTIDLRSKVKNLGGSGTWSLLSTVKAGGTALGLASNSNADDTWRTDSGSITVSGVSTIIQVQADVQVGGGTTREFHVSATRCLCP